MNHPMLQGRRPLPVFCIILLVLFSRPSAASVVLSELFYDADGIDRGRVFVELFGLPGTLLDEYFLLGINGARANAYLNVPLSGVIPEDGVFVIADDQGDGSTLVPEADLVTRVDFQNGPDSVQLWQGDELRDALGYGQFDEAFFAGEGHPAMDTGAGRSLARRQGQDSNDNAMDFILLADPTPGQVLPADTLTVPLPGSLGLMAMGLGLLGGWCRRG